MDLDNLQYNFKRFFVPGLLLLLSLIAFFLALNVKSDLAHCNLEEIDEQKKREVLAEKNVSDIEKVPFEERYVAKQEQIKIKQNQYYLYGTLGMVLLSVVIILMVANMVDRKLAFGLIAVFLGMIIYFGYLTMNHSIKKSNTYANNKAKIYKETKQRMLDIYEAEKQFRNDKGRYSESLDELIDYLKNYTSEAIEYSQMTPQRSLTPEETAILGIDTIQVLYREKEMTREQAIELGIVKEIKIRSNAQQMIFENKRKPYLRELSDWEYQTFKESFADSLKYVPYVDPRDNKRYEFDYVVDSFYVRTDTLNLVSPVKDARGRALKAADGKDSITFDLEKRYDYFLELRMPNPWHANVFDHKCEPADSLILGSIKEKHNNPSWK
jgi:NADH:ubiquinone oxidoreductase subunit 3 (subunit A)